MSLLSLKKEDQSIETYGELLSIRVDYGLATYRRDNETSSDGEKKSFPKKRRIED